MSIFILIKNCKNETFYNILIGHFILGGTLILLLNCLVVNYSYKELLNTVRITIHDLYISWGLVLRWFECSNSQFTCFDSSYFRLLKILILLISNCTFTTKVPNTNCVN